MFPPSDAFVLKLDSAGNFVWAARMGGGSLDGGSSPNDYGRSISVDSSYHVHVLGQFTESGDFDPTDGELMLESTGLSDLFVLKLNQPSPLSGSAPSTSPCDDVLGLLASQVEPLFAQALANWNAAGVETSGLSDLEFRLADLPARTLGLASGSTIFIDRDAAGRGWFIEPVGHQQLDFSGGASESLSVADGRYDLFSVIAHEIGHVLGHRHSHDETDLMSPHLTPGIRRLPVGLNPAITHDDAHALGLDLLGAPTVVRPGLRMGSPLRATLLFDRMVEDAGRYRYQDWHTTEFVTGVPIPRFGKSNDILQTEFIDTLMQKRESEDKSGDDVVELIDDELVEVLASDQSS